MNLGDDARLTRTRAPRRALLVSVVAVLATVMPSAGAAAPGDATELFRFQDPAIKESSGVAVSALRPGVIFTHNDGGDTARFFAVADDGCTVATYTVVGAEAHDWEDMARSGSRGHHPTLWFGDIGDNAVARVDGVTVYQVPEPLVPKPAPNPDGSCGTPTTGSVAATRFDLRYADGPHDAETLLVQPKTSRVFVVTKSLSGAPLALYAAPVTLQAGTVGVLEKVADLTLPPGTLVATLVTSGDLSPDGRHLVLRTYAGAIEWRVRGGDLAAALGRAPTSIVLPATLQGEAIAYTPDGTSVITTSEDPLGTGAPVARVRVR